MVGTGEMYVSITFPSANISLLFLVDSSVTYSEISPEIPHSPSGDRSIEVIGSLNQLYASFFPSVVPT